MLSVFLFEEKVDACVVIDWKNMKVKMDFPVRLEIADVVSFFSLSQKELGFWSAVVSINTSNMIALDSHIRAWNAKVVYVDNSIVLGREMCE